MRKLAATIGLVGLVLAACTANSETTPSMASSPGITSEAPSASVLASPVAMACSDAFAIFSASDLAAITSLSAAQDKLDTTIQACPTMDDWTNAARTALPAVDLGQVQEFVKSRCQQNTSLAGTQLCQSVGS